MFINNRARVGRPISLWLKSTIRPASRLRHQVSLMYWLQQLRLTIERVRIYLKRVEKRGGSSGLHFFEFGHVAQIIQSVLINF